MAARDELVAAIAGRYSQADRTERSRILDEFTAVTGFHRKHAMRLLRAGSTEPAFGPTTWAPGLRRRGTGSADCDLGGVGPDLRQAAAAAGAGSGRGDGAAWPSPARAGGAHQPAGDERGDDRPGLARRSGGKRDDRHAARRRLRRRSGAACRCARLTAGTIRRPASSRRIWSRIAGRWRRAASCKRWC